MLLALVFTIVSQSSSAAVNVRNSILSFHCIKSARIRSYPGPYSVRMRDNADKNNSAYDTFHAVFSSSSMLINEYSGFDFCNDVNHTEPRNCTPTLFPTSLSAICNLSTVKHANGISEFELLSQRTMPIWDFWNCLEFCIDEILKLGHQIQQSTCCCST